ncbi:XRE family transcriptional regulator [soil metagenome]
MAKRHRFSDLAADAYADPVRRQRIEQMAEAMRDAVRLHELRASRGVTQQDLATALGVSQANVSRVEHVDDVYLTTLRGYVEALGGHLHLSAVFDDETVEIAIGDMK